MNNEVKKIKFQDGELLGIKDKDGQVWLGISKACKDIGLSQGQANRQRQNIQSDLVLSKGCANLVIPTDGGNQNVECIKEDFVTLWLAKISLTPKMQKENSIVVEKLMTYQLEAQKVLHEAFMATEEQKQEFYSNVGIHGEILDLKNKIESMEETMKTMIESSTINTYQQQRLYKTAKDRINKLLGGAHSNDYKSYSKSYFINMWNGFKENFSISSYKDLNPVNLSMAIDFINNWKYTGDTFA